MSTSRTWNHLIPIYFFVRWNFSIEVLPALAFENLNSLETLNIQNNKLTRIPEEVMEPIIDTLRVVDIVGKYIDSPPRVYWMIKMICSRQPIKSYVGRLWQRVYVFPKLNLSTFVFASCADNPLICSCELIWFPNLLQDLKNRDDEMTQKKRPMCTMANEHREYFVQSMPVERMNCIGKNLGIQSLSGANTSKRLQSNLSSCTVLILSLYSVITAYFLNWNVNGPPGPRSIFYTKTFST